MRRLADELEARADELERAYPAGGNGGEAFKAMFA